MSFVFVGAVKNIVTMLEKKQSFPHIARECLKAGGPLQYTNEFCKVSSLNFLASPAFLLTVQLLLPIPNN